jgi:hypothetical protein
MNTFLIYVLIIIVLLDGILKYNLANKGHDLSILIEKIVEKIGWIGYFIVLVIILGVIALIDNFLLNFVLIALMTFIILKQMRELKNV